MVKAEGATEAKKTIARERKLSAEERIARGKAAREKTPRASHADWQPSPDRPDLVSLLKEQAATRLPELIAIRHGRMSASPFTFYRGSAIVMAADLAGTPVSGSGADLRGRAPVELRRLRFPGAPDDVRPERLRRDAARAVGVGREADGRELRGRRARGRVPARDRTAGGHARAVESYRARMAEFAGMRDLDVWYSHITSDEILAATTTRGMRKRTEKAMAKARTKDSLQAFAKLTTVVDGRPQIVNDPPLIVRVERAELPSRSRPSSAVPSHAPGRPQASPRAVRVRGPGAQGGRRRERRHPLLHRAARGPRRADPLFLQMKEAQSSVLERPPAQEPVPQPRAARRRRSALHAGLERHLPRVDRRAPGRTRLLLAPAARHEGLGGRRGDGPTGSGLRGALRLGARSGARPFGRPDRDRRLPGQERRVREAVAEFSETTPTRPSGTTRRCSTRSPKGRSRPRSASDGLRRRWCGGVGTALGEQRIPNS